MDYTEEQKAEILAEYARRRANNERAKDIEADFKRRGIPRTFQNWRTQAKKKEETPMSEETPVEVLDGQMDLEASDTVPEVYTDAVGEFYTLPAGYAKIIQPMREYTEAEDAALKESVRLFGFIGAIVRDQFGRILDGNQRARVAHWFGTGCPYTITEVKDDAHALAIATSLNAVRRQYPREQREQIALAMRDQGFSYRVIAEALGVSKDTVQRDIKSVSDETPGPLVTMSPVSHETPQVAMTSEVETNFPPEVEMKDPPVSHETPDPVKRVTGRDKKSYPGQRPTGRKPKTSKSFDTQEVEDRIKDLYMEWLRRCEDEPALLRANAFLGTLKGLTEGRAKILLQTE